MYHHSHWLQPLWRSRLEETWQTSYWGFISRHRNIKYNVLFIDMVKNEKVQVLKKEDTNLEDTNQIRNSYTQ